MPQTSGSPSDLTLFFADDHKIVRDGLRVLTERTPGFKVIGEASDGRALVAGALDKKPDIVVTDMAMTELNGIEATRQLRAAGYAGTIVMLSMHDGRRHISQALEAGINAYVHKDHAFEQILEAIHAARRGEIWLSPQLAHLMEDAGVPTLTDILSAREREVLQLFAEGQGTKEIAFRLELSPKTVETHRMSLFSKLRATSVVELTRIAIKEGLVHL